MVHEVDVHICVYEVDRKDVPRGSWPGGRATTWWNCHESVVLSSPPNEVDKLQRRSNGKARGGNATKDRYQTRRRNGLNLCRASQSAKFWSLAGLRCFT